MKRILLLGGTGAMGLHLVNILETKNVEVVVTTRQKLKSHSNVRYVTGNAHDKGFVMGILEKMEFDVIVDFMAYKTSEFIEYVSLFLDSCKQYVYLSSSRVYSNRDEYITEETPLLVDVCKDKEYLASDEYALAKARQEEILAKSGKVNWTIIRPYITYSENRLQLGVLEKENWLYRAMHGRTIVFSNDIADKYTTLTYGYDVARGIISIIGNEAALGQVFHITDGCSLRWSDVLNLYLDELEKKNGKRPKVLMLEKCPVLLRPLSCWQVKVDRLYNRRFNNNKIGQYIDLQSFTSPEVGLIRCLDICLQDVKYGVINWRSEARYDRMTKECAKRKEFDNLKQYAKYLILRYLVPMSKL